VDCGGAADRAGLRIGDRIVEVNGHNVEYESHQSLIEAVCAQPNTADLIVVDEEYDKQHERWVQEQARSHEGHTGVVPP